MGPRDLENGTVEVARRDTLTKEIVPLEGIEAYIADLLDKIQENIYTKALDFREENTREANSWEEFKNLIENAGGFVAAHWDGTAETEDAIKNETKATIRCIPLKNANEEGRCIYSGKPSKERVLFAKSY
mgnify:CR=1 FL=1